MAYAAAKLVAMSFKGSEVIARPFLEWKADDVTKWLTTLVLAKDYSAQFIGKGD